MRWATSPRSSTTPATGSSPRTLPSPDGTAPQPVYHYTYDAAGELTSQTDPLGNVTTYVYDNLGRKIEEIDPDPATGASSQSDANCPKTYYAYDLVGNLLSATDPAGHTTSYTYDGLNECMTVTDPSSGVTSYTHDMMGDVTSLTDPDDNTTNWTYDGLGRVIEETDPLGHSEYYQYDLSGNLTETIDRDGRVTEYTYDHLNRETHEYWYANTTDAENDPNHSSAEETFSYAYDANNDLLTASDASATAANASATYNFEYGAVGWVVQTTAQITGLTPTVTLSSISGHAYAPDLGQDVPLPDYDANGNRLGLTVSIGSTDDFSNTYTYDNLGRLTSVTQSGQGGNAVAPKRVDFTYDADNQDATITQYADLAGTQQVATGAYTYDVNVPPNTSC